MNLRGIGAATSCAFCLWVAFNSTALAADSEDLLELRRAIRELQEQNRALFDRVKALEAERTGPSGQSGQPKAGEPQVANRPATPAGNAPLEERVRELEVSKAAQEQATRHIIQDSMSTLGSKINEAVAFGGSIETVAGRSKDFGIPSKSSINLNAEVDFEIQVNPWTLGTLALEYVNGLNVQFPTNQGFETGVDRINLDRAFVQIGDTQRFPFFIRAGRMYLPFGTSTGVHRADVLSIENPLTIEAFETREDAIGLGFAFPTPALKPVAPPVFAPPVRPLVIAPAVARLARGLGYKPLPTRSATPTPVPVTPEMPPFYGSIYVYDNSDTAAVQRGFNRNTSARLGYRTNGTCGRAYHELSGTGLCPWSFDLNVDYNSSVFSSGFLATEYRPFLNQIGPVNGMAVSAKGTFGPFSLVAEWNGALDQAVFLDAGRRISIRPAARQISLGYQFDWNPWVQNIGAQGTFVAVAYSETSDLAGVQQSINGVSSRVGFLPKRRLVLTAGEWVLDGVKVVIEYSSIWDYSLSQGGTGATGHGIFSSLSYQW